MGEIEETKKLIEHKKNFGLVIDIDRSPKETHILIRLRGVHGYIKQLDYRAYLRIEDEVKEDDYVKLFLVDDYRAVWRKVNKYGKPLVQSGRY